MQETPTVQQPTPPQQPPMYPPTYQPPQKPPRSRKRLWLIIGIIAAVLVIGVIGASMAASGGQQPTTQSTQQVTTQPTQPPATQVPQSNTIGKPVQVGDTWLVTVNSAKANAGSEFSQPKSGYTYLVVDVTLKNTSSSVQPVSSLLMFSLTDQTGQKYTEAITDFAKATPDGKVSPGSLLSGELVYEVPSSMHTFTLAFEPSLLTNEMAEWKLTV